MEIVTDLNMNCDTGTTENVIYSTKASKSKEIKENTPLIIRTNNTSQQFYTSSFYKNKIRKINNVHLKRLSKTAIYGSKNHHLEEKRNVISSKKIQKKKLSYETEFKPSTLTNKSFIRYGRKQLIVDQQIMINSRQFKTQLNDTNDLTSMSDLAPRTKRQMERLLNGITKLFAYPARQMVNSKLLQLYVTNCTTKMQPNVETLTDMKLLPVDYSDLENIVTPKKKGKHTLKLSPISIVQINTPANKRKRKHSETDKLLKNHQKISEIDKCDSEMQILVEAANSISDNYECVEQVIQSNEVIDSDDIVGQNTCQNNIEIVKNEILALHDINSEESEIVTLKSDELYTLKAEDDNDDRQVVVIQRLGENIEVSQKNLEAILSAANTNKQQHQLFATYSSLHNSDLNKIILKQESDEEIFGM